MTVVYFNGIRCEAIKMRMRIFVSLFLISLVQPGFADSNDFDKVCGYFDELSSQKSLAGLTHQERNHFIINRIQQDLQTESDARTAWEAVSAASAKQRYFLFKSAAETVLKHAWSCPSMEKLAEGTGEFD